MKLKFCFCFEKSIRIRTTFYKVDSKQNAKPYLRSSCAQNVSSSYKRETLIAQPDNGDEAQENDKYAVSIYKKNDAGSKELVGHAPVEFSSLLYHFLQASAENCMNVEVIGKRKRDVGLVVPARHNVLQGTKRQQWYWMKNVLSAEKFANLAQS